LPLLVLFLTGTSFAKSLVVFDSISPIQNGGAGASVTGGAWGLVSSAAEFVPSASGTLLGIDLRVWLASPYLTADIDVSLVQNSPGGSPSQTVLASGMITATTGPLDPQFTRFQPNTSALLLAGTPYWLVLSPHDPSSSSAWTLSDYPGYLAQTMNPNPSSDSDWAREFLPGGPGTGNGLPQFRVYAVPEPSFFGLSLGALALVLLRMSRASRSVI
jgi:hypothetical protein